ncbi:hypothetical protein [Ralstonia sp. 3PA37C10]|jgi:hypothetical protein|uniref:hypothetical protein n=1 Tax=unclassified Ralstonia TaxID=209769 RepID=UPI0010F8EA7C|nr:hypothetical protein [Ralstonia sp. 3PA37C10]
MLTNHYRTRDYRVARSLTEAFGPYAELATERRKHLSDRALDWLGAICVGIGIGVTLYLVAAFAAGPGA